MQLLMHWAWKVIIEAYKVASLPLYCEDSPIQPAKDCSDYQDTSCFSAGPFLVQWDGKLLPESDGKLILFRAYIFVHQC